MRKVTGLKAMLLLLMLLSIVAFFLWRLEDLNSREIRPENFSFINKIEIYILGLVLGIGAYPIYPEVAATHLSLYWKNGSDEREINDDFFLKSKVVQSAIQRSVKTNQRTQLAWPASAYTLSFDKGRYWESRVALALNGGSLSIKNEFVEVAIDWKYPPKSLAPLIQIPGIGLIAVEEGLFWVLQEEGWLTPKRAKWVARMKR